MKKKIFVIVQCVLVIMIIMSMTVIEATGFLTTHSDEHDNVFKLLLGQSDTDARFNLKDIIPENIIVRNQGRANNCWNFAAIGALETTLALKRKKHSEGVKVFDFSEAHVKYGSRYLMFLNGKKNVRGFNAVRTDGGNFMDAINYMTNGFGPVEEKWLKYNPNEPDIDLNSIESITQAATVMDTVNLSVEDTSDENAINDAISKIKTHIKNYGGVYFALNYRVGDQYTNTANMAR